jgi:drug/metabolite transporter (DMT)-like permease
MKCVKQVSGSGIVILAAMSWATSGILINIITAKTNIPALNLAFWRDFGTFLVLFVGLLIFQPELLRIRSGDLPYLVGMGVISIAVFHVLWNISVVMLGASLGTVLQSNAPIFVSILAWIFFQEPFTFRKLTALAFSVLGTVFSSGIFGVGEVQVAPVGLLLALLAAISYGSLSLFGKKLAREINPLTNLVYIFGFAALVLSPFQFYRPFPWSDIVTVLPELFGLIFIPTIIGFLLYTIGLKFLAASIASITATTEIIFAAILAYVLLNERLDTLQILGAVCIILGVVLVSLPRNHKKQRFLNRIK